LQTITIVGGIVAALVLVTITYRFTSKEWGELGFLAKDSAMLTDAILAAPQDVQAVYPQEFVQWYAKLDNYTVSFHTSPPEPNVSSPFYYYYVRRGDISIREGDVKLSSLFFIKQNNDFMLDNTPVMPVEKEADK
jgi:hypothetical protein